MSELIERISREVGIFRSEQEKAEILAAELKQDRIAKVESLLEETGVRPLLEEIKDSGFLRWSSEPVHDEHGQTTSDYTPAKIVLWFNTVNYQNNACIALKYDYDGHSNCKAIAFSITENEVVFNHHQPGVRRITTPMNPDVLEATVIEAINYPSVMDV